MLENVITRLTEKDKAGEEGSRTGKDVEPRMDADTNSSTADDSTTVDSDGDGTVEEGPAIDLDQVFGVLGNRRRRDILRYLAAESEGSRLGTLAERIAARECGKDVSQINSQERKRVYVALYQCHLPKMADVGAITYDKPRGTVERGPNFDLFEHHLPEDEVASGSTDGNGVLQSLTGFVR
jgi:DNA-binding transcriptional ArsR family regulator